MIAKQLARWDTVLSQSLLSDCADCWTLELILITKNFNDVLQVGNVETGNDVRHLMKLAAIYFANKSYGRTLVMCVKYDTFIGSLYRLLHSAIYWELFLHLQTMVIWNSCVYL